MTTTQQKLNENQAEPANLELSAEEVLMLQEMAEAGLLYGLMKKKTHPGMKPWIFATRSGVEIINLENTIKEISKVNEFLNKVSSNGKQILIVGTSPAAKGIAKEIAEETGQPYVNERWLGGTLTNFKVISNRIKHYNKLIADRESGALEKYTKKERLLIDKKLEKMKLLFEGIRNLTEMPGAMLVLDMPENIIAAKEASSLGIPVAAIINTDTDPKSVDYPIPANNRLGESIKLILNHLKNSIKKKEKIAEKPVEETLKTE